MDKPRFLKKLTCESCNGYGFTASVVDAPCRECSGKGWVEPEPRKEAICSRCDGRGVVPMQKRTDCIKCGGKGYFVRVYQITEKRCRAQTARATRVKSNISTVRDAVGLER